MSWLSRVLGRSVPSPKGTDSGSVIKLDGVEGESKPADHKGEIETHLTAEPDQSEGAFDAFLELDGIKGETEDRAAALLGGDPDRPIIIGSVPNPPVPGGPVPVPYPLAEDAASRSQALDIGGNETLTVGGARREAGAMPGLQKSTDVT